MATKWAISLLFLVSFFNSLAMGNSTVIDWKCNGTKFGTNSNYAGNLKSLLHALIDGKAQFAAVPHGESNDQNGAYGLSQCIGEVSEYDCNICAQEARYFIEQTCPQSVGASIWSNWCFLRYENYDFISKLGSASHTKPPCRENQSFGSQKSMAIPQKLMQDLSARAPETENLFASKSVRGMFLNMKVDIKGYAQCWRDLSKNDCRKCLSHGVKQIEQYCRGRRSKAQFLSDNCVLTYVMTVSPGSPSKSEMAPLALKQYPEDHGYQT